MPDPRLNDMSLILAKAKRAGFFEDVLPTEVDFLEQEAKAFFDTDIILSGLKGTPGKKYRVIAGALRNEGSPDYWRLISDAAHVPVGISSVTSDGSTITVNYSFQASTIGSLVVVTDETLGKLNVFAGASVGLSSATIVLSQPADNISDLVYYDGAAWQSQNLQYTIDSYTAGVLSLTHRDIGATSGNAQVSSRGGARRAVLANASPPVSSTNIKIEFYDNAGTLVTTPDVNMKALISRFSRPGARNPQTLVTTATEPNHNLWVFGIHEVA